MPRVTVEPAVRVWIGIDPGQSGGLARIVVVNDGNWGKASAEVTKMPSTEADIIQVLREWSEDQPGNPPVTATIENVHSMPGQGVSSTFKFGRGYGFLRGVVQTLRIPLHDVAPRTWQKALGVKGRASNESKVEFKNRLKGLAQRLFPQENVTLAVADALLIAEYARRSGR